MSEKLITGISHGDINGVAYELILKTFSEPRMYESLIPVLYGSSKALAYHRKIVDLPAFNVSNISNANDAAANRMNVINFESEEVTVELAHSTPEGERLADAAFRRAVDDLKQGRIDVLISAPSNVDESAFLATHSVEGKSPLNILVKDNLRIVIASDKISISEVASTLKTDVLVRQIKDLHSVLVHDFLINFPRIAVLSLNPGLGIKERNLGKEESEIIAPAVAEAGKTGIVCFGPYSADDFFGSEDYTKFDAIVAMYYDQGSVPFRTLTRGEGVCYTSGLPFVRVTPDIGVCYDRAGKNETSESAFRNAIYLATDIFNNRVIDREINANPLKKEYHERGSDNEKLDLTKDED
ncbi:MAG: 4-hydroxythreonine-4-phosphate dehydrogenase PdxA [Dysgonamonadaceae bacterium]|jgi:4-hydroxythreonine-4-phosphate dehydrogenase|nr:4-hydroxythreonine-4-phosphate dehydrogenase PdxA [Dysgonamonadaceae bacterium]